MEHKPSYRIILEDRHWDIDIKDDPEYLPEIIERDGNQLIIRYGNRHFKAEVISEDPLAKTYELSINGRQFTLSLQTPLDAMIADMGLNRSTKKSANTLTAPMPGMVLELNVNVGDQVAEGESLLILEAMKMENVLKSIADVTVKEVLVKKGDAVDKGQALIVFE